MENASKALIIAGAILLSILLISLGIMVYQNARGTIDSANLNSEEIQAFNTKISQYCGRKKSANDMNALMDAISASNGSQKGLGDQHYIGYGVTDLTTYFTGDASKSADDIKTAANPTTGGTATNIKYPRFSSGVTYKADYESDASGYIVKVNIAQDK